MGQKFSFDLKTTVMILIIIGITIVVSFLFRLFIKASERRLMKKEGYDLTGYSFLKHIINSLIYIIGISTALVQVPELKIVGHSLLAGAGVASLVLGLASQQALSNIMSGILIVIFKPFRINDRITIRENVTGIVEDINLRQVVIRDFENNRIIIPNSVIGSELIVNAHISDNKSCKFIDVGIGYSSDVERALEIMKEEVTKHPLHIDNRTAEEKKNHLPVAIARVIGLGESSVNLRCWAWSQNAADGYIMECDLLQSIKKRFDIEGIEIPFPQRTVTVKKS
jgi:small-conductance mechanosensitive channel